MALRCRLSICRKLAARMHGDVWLENAAAEDLAPLGPATLGMGMGVGVGALGQALSLPLARGTGVAKQAGAGTAYSASESAASDGSDQARSRAALLSSAGSARVPASHTRPIGAADAAGVLSSQTTQQPQYQRRQVDADAESHSVVSSEAGGGTAASDVAAGGDNDDDDADVVDRRGAHIVCYHSIHGHDWV
jgi:hypothetical protein